MAYILQIPQALAYREINRLSATRDSENTRLTNGNSQLISPESIQHTDLLLSAVSNILSEDTTNYSSTSSSFNDDLIYNVRQWQEGINPEYKYINLLIVLTIAFFSTAYYFYLFKKQKNTINTQLRENLVVAFLVKGVALLYSVLTLNPKNNDIKSFFNFFLFHFSVIVFQSLLLDYVELLINTYYYLKVNKYDTFLTSNLFTFKIIYYSVFFFVSFLLFTVHSYLALDYLFFIVNGGVGITISFLFIYYGVGLARLYNNQKNNEYSLRKEGKSNQFSLSHNKYTGYDPELLNETRNELKSILRIKIFTVCFTVSLTHFVQGLSFFILGVDYFGKEYFDFMNPNLFDFLTVFFGTYVCGVVIGFTKISSNIIPKKYFYDEDKTGNSLTESFISTNAELIEAETEMTNNKIVLKPKENDLDEINDESHHSSLLTSKNNNAYFKRRRTTQTNNP